jgi:hypothetical protein
MLWGEEEGIGRGMSRKPWYDKVKREKLEQPWLAGGERKKQQTTLPNFLPNLPDNLR